MGTSSRSRYYQQQQQQDEQNARHRLFSVFMGEDALPHVTIFLLYLFLIHPICSWMLTPGRLSNSPRKSQLYALAFLVAITAIIIGTELDRREPNYYELLGVHRSVRDVGDIKRAYKKQSLYVHPDKNGNPDAAAHFARLTHAYDVLIDPLLRDAYDRYGTAVDGGGTRTVYESLFVIALYHVPTGLVAYLLTTGQRREEVRYWIFSGLLFLLIVEMTLLTTTSVSVNDNPIIPHWLFPQLTIHEMIALFHALFPAYMCGCRSFGASIHATREHETNQLLQSLHEQNKEILFLLRDIQINGVGSERIQPSSTTASTEVNVATSTNTATITAPATTATTTIPSTIHRRNGTKK